MRAHGYFTLTLAAIVTLGMFLAAGMRASGQPFRASAPGDQPTASADRALDALRPLQPRGSASELSGNVADLPTADRRDCDAGGTVLPRLSQLPRALGDAADGASLAAVLWRCSAVGALPDDRPHLSQTLVIEHVRLQI